MHLSRSLSRHEKQHDEHVEKSGLIRERADWGKKRASIRAAQDADQHLRKDAIFGASFGEKRAGNILRSRKWGRSRWGRREP